MRALTLEIKIKEAILAVFRVVGTKLIVESVVIPTDGSTFCQNEVVADNFRWFIIRQLNWKQ